MAMAQHRRRARRAVVVVALLVVAACGRGSMNEARAASPDGSPPTSRTSTSSTAPTSTEPSEVEVTLAFSGDILTHMPVVASAAAAAEGQDPSYDFASLLAPTAPVISGVDLALCHLEVPIAAEGQRIQGFPTFHAPAEVAAGIAATGYDGCSTASNHSLDGGRAGVVATLDALDAAGLGHAGTARSEAEAAAPTLYEVDGTQVAHLSYAFGFNGRDLPVDAPWAANLIDPERIAADARTARAAGADLVVVSVHWGTEYQHEPDARQEEWAQAITAIPEVDLVIGHHAHVVQPVDRVNDKWVVFGLGNHLSNQQGLTGRDGLTVRVVARGRPGGPLHVEQVQAVPTWVDLDTHRVYPAVHLPLPDGTPQSVVEDAAVSALRTMEVVSSRGAVVPVYEG